jgi:hypothetical protein
MASTLRLPISPLVFQLPERLTEVNAWHGHLPFAFWIVEAAQPSVLVELGVHRGDSYFGFCQAVRALELPTRCYGVDTWKGDSHAGYYGEEVYEEFLAYNTEHYGEFSIPLRATFQGAVEHFDDKGIDLLHIDGYHSYESVREDFSHWLPKLSDRAVVLLHDIAVRDRGFGVWRFWEEVSSEYPSFGFTHSHGLGVLGVGKELPEAVVDFFDEAKAQPALVQNFFEALGARCVLQGELLRAKAPAAMEATGPRVAQEILDLTYDYEQALRRKEAEAEVLEAQLAALEARARSAEHTVADLGARLGEVAAQRDEVLQSETWKMTEPARNLLWWARRIFNWRRFAQPLTIALE